MSRTRQISAAVHAAFPYTVPVLTGYVFTGIAYGVLMRVNGYGALFTVAMSMVCYCGSMQFVAVPLLCAAFNPLYAFVLTLTVNARHLFYGVSMLEKYRGIGRIKPLLIFTMSDETFTILAAAEPPSGVSRGGFYLAVSLMDHTYWWVGGLLGSLAGGMITFDTTGIDFALTALIVSMFTGLCKKGGRASAAIGVGIAAVCLALFGADSFIIPAMVMILAVLSLSKVRRALCK
jgi:4-azaleucine resistance transporter AzlC